jgi:hypothetical protein
MSFFFFLGRNTEEEEKDAHLKRVIKLLRDL